MDLDECQAMVHKLRKKKPTIWLKLTQGGRNNTELKAASALGMSLDEYREQVTKDGLIELVTFRELAQYLKAIRTLNAEEAGQE